MPANNENLALGHRKENEICMSGNGQNQTKVTMPPQHQDHQPGIEGQMEPLPQYE